MTIIKTLSGISFLYGMMVDISSKMYLRPSSPWVVTLRTTLQIWNFHIKVKAFAFKVK